MIKVKDIVKCDEVICIVKRIIDSEDDLTYYKVKPVTSDAIEIWATEDKITPLIKVKDFMMGYYDLQIHNKQGQYIGLICSADFIDDQADIKLFANRKVYYVYKDLGSTNDPTAPLNLVVNYKC
ncbi:MAG: hypothetical protein ACK5LC_08690 [Coprobacillaceae bacterium]